MKGRGLPITRKTSPRRTLLTPQKQFLQVETWLRRSTIPGEVDCAARGYNIAIVAHQYAYL